MKDPDYGVRKCCMPTCNRTVPRNREHDVCQDCGIEIAIAHWHQASMRSAVAAELRARRDERREQRRQQLAANSVVYYIEVRPGVVKIGYTGNLKKRLMELRVSHTALLAIEPGGRDVEQERHQWFAHVRIHARREDFDLAPEIQGHIAAMRVLHPLPRWATLPDTSVVTRK